MVKIEVPYNINPMKLNILHLKMMVRTVLVGALLCSVNAAMSQVNFTQTTTNDFMKGSGLNVTIADNAVSLQGKMASVSDWAAASNLPQVLKGHQTTTWRNYIYLVGGHNGSNYVNNVYRATQQDNGISGWSSLNGLPLALKDMAVVATQTQLLVIGGHNNDTVSNRIYAAKLNDDGSIGSWTESAVTLPEARWGMSAVMCMDHLYIIGGATADNAVTNTVYCLKLNADGVVVSLSQVNGLPEARNGHAVTVYDSKLIVTGGYDAMQTAKNTVYTAAVNLDGTLGAWQTKTALPVAVYNHTTVCSNGILTAIGGHDGTLPSNRFYYADLSANTWIWTLSDVMLPERYTEGASFAFGDKIFFCGGQNISNALSNYTRFMAVTTTEAPVGKSAFIGKPFYVGAPKTLHQLVYTLNYTASNTSYEILYRMAGPDKVFGNWISSGSNSPAVINQSNSYIQYMFRFTANGNDNLSLDDVTLTVSGFTQLAGNLNDMSSLTLAGSPYWVTSDISFTTGVHNIEAGVVIYFRANTGLNIGQASVNFNGTATQHILLTYEDEEAGMWNGVYYQDASDNNGLTSVMSHTTIEKAGNGDNDANLRLHYTNQPTINNCTFTNADGMGLRLCNSHPTISGTVMSDNSFSGLDLESATPTCNACVMSGNLYGIYYRNNNFGATLQGVTTTGNTYGLYSCTPDHTFTLDAAALSFVNNGTDIAVAGGRIANDQTWNLFPNGYALLGNVEVYGGTPKLTIAPGNTIKGAVNTSLYIGNGSSQGGMLYAVGTATDSIVFTSLNGKVGGWNGLNFRDGSDYNSLSSMRFCKVEKANTNIYCASTTQPGIMWCTIQDAANVNIDLNSSNLSIDESIVRNAPKGLMVNSSNPSLVSVVFDNHSEACIWHQNACVITYFTCTLKNSHFGIRYHTPNMDFLNNINVTCLNNECNIAMPEGDISDNHVWHTNTYAILGNIRVLKGGYNYSGEPSRLTLSPGCTLKFAENTNMQISNHFLNGNSHYNYLGELNAIGTETQPITFTSLNGEVGGWNGIYFHNYSDYVTGQESVLQYCIIEKGNEYNLHLSSTNQPSVIENCTFRNANGYGLYFSYCGDWVTVSDCQFQNNGNYGLYFNQAYYVHDFENLNFTGNLHDVIAMGGGDISENRTWNTYEYHILESIHVGKGGNNYSGEPSRLTLSPGCTLKFAENTNMQISNHFLNGNSHYNYLGELNAIGTETQPITFTSLNGEVGGWNGIYFHNYSDYVTGQESVLQHCIIEKGNEYNLLISYSNQPTVDCCKIVHSNGYGLGIENCSPTISKSVIKDNATYGVLLNGNSSPVIGGNYVNGCSIYHNGDYNIYHNGTSNFTMNYNYIGAVDSLYIGKHVVYDKQTDPNKGHVNVYPVSWLPMHIGEYDYNGKLYYDNNPAKPLTGVTLAVKGFQNEILAETTVDGDGDFAFNDIDLSVANKIEVASGIDFPNAITSVSALFVKRHFAHLMTLEGNHAVVADVNKSQTINGTDALLIQRHVAHLISTFPTGDLLMSTDTAYSNGNQFTMNLSALCYGDVDGRYSGFNRDNGLELELDGHLVIESKQALDIPVRINAANDVAGTTLCAKDVAAITLRLSYPDEYLDIEDIILSATGESLLYGGEAGQLNISWCNLNSISLAAGDELLLIKTRAKDLSLLEEEIAFTIEGYSELNDVEGNKLPNIILLMPTLTTKLLSMTEDTTNAVLSIYPNPTKGETVLRYQLPDEGCVSIALFDMMGMKVVDLGNALQGKGQHEVRFNAGSLDDGFYYCRFVFTGKNEFVKTVKVVVEK